MAELPPVDVAIVGGGPAGLGAALSLRHHGVARVLVLEREEAAGGVPRHCGHPPFGMREFGRVLAGPAYARRLVERAVAAGVEIRCEHSVVGVQPGGGLLLATPDGPATLAAGRAVLATGVRESSRHARLLSGDRPLGVLTTGALQAMVHLKGIVPFRRPVIVGTELVSLSALLTCRRAGIRPAAVVEAHRGPTARPVLALFPRLLGVPVHYGTEIAAIHGRSRVDGVTLRTAGRAPLELACDGVLLTGRFTPEATLVRPSHLELDTASGGPAVDQYGRCSDPTWYAAGNLLRPVETAGWCHREGQRIGTFVARDLAGELPAAQPSLPVMRGRGVKLAVPQRLCPGAAGYGSDPLQLRVSEPVTGELRLAVGGRTVWRRRLAALPERRILVPLAGVALPADAGTVEVGFA
jgi:NADPH-dependent 2,4-dienoyl-CoA reductase/sulfur reductase-like enzyme